MLYSLVLRSCGSASDKRAVLLATLTQATLARAIVCAEARDPVLE